MIKIEQLSNGFIVTFDDTREFADVNRLAELISCYWVDVADAVVSLSFDEEDGQDEE